MASWKVPIFKRKYILNWWMFQCHFSLGSNTRAIHTSLFIRETHPKFIEGSIQMTVEIAAFIHPERLDHWSRVISLFKGN